jgi:hypothetical protein
VGQMIMKVCNRNIHIKANSCKHTQTQANCIKNSQKQANKGK